MEGGVTLSVPEDGAITDHALARTAELARTDLAARLRIDPAPVEVLRAEHMTWPKGSLGCGPPLGPNAKALVEGARVILGIARRTRIFVYHAGSDGVPFPCPSSEPDGGYDFVPPPGIDV